MDGVLAAADRDSRRRERIDRLCLFAIVTSDITSFRGFVVFNTTVMKRPSRPVTVTCMKIVIPVVENANLAVVSV